jgi:hypothetical protein
MYHQYPSLLLERERKDPEAACLSLTGRRKENVCIQKEITWDGLGGRRS